jgi:hypothetical protein
MLKPAARCLCCMFRTRAWLEIHQKPMLLMPRSSSRDLCCMFRTCAWLEIHQKPMLLMPIFSARYLYCMFRTRAWLEIHKTDGWNALNPNVFDLISVARCLCMVRTHGWPGGPLCGEWSTVPSEHAQAHFLIFRSATRCLYCFFQDFFQARQVIHLAVNRQP